MLGSDDSYKSERRGAEESSGASPETDLEGFIDDVF
jgi:hypothetical protein